MRLVDRLLGRTPEPEPAPPAPRDAVAQQEAAALRQTAQLLQETRSDHDDDRYW